MKTVEEILSSGVIYSDKLKIDTDGFSGFLVVDRVNMSFVASWGGGWDHVSVAPHWNLCQAFNFEELISKLPDLLEDVSIAIAKVYEATADVVKSLKKALESIDTDQLLSIYVKTSEVKENE